MHSSNAMMMSAPRPISAAMALSGLKKCDEPSRCERNCYALFRHLAQIAEAEDLEATRIRQDGLVPRHELLHAAELSHRLDARPQIKVVGVVQQDLDAQLFQRVLRHALDRCKRANRHEDGRLHLAMRREEASGARCAIACLDLEAKGHRGRL